LTRLDELHRSAALRWYGALLAFTHVITYVFWSKIPALLAQRPGNAVCWPFFESCWKLHPISQSLMHGVLHAYLALAIVGVLLFFGERLSRHCTTAAYVALLVMNLVKLAIFVLDYRLMGNYHYMPFVVSFAFLFCRDKAALCRYLIVGFYLSAGSLKLNAEWLSGAALLRPAFLTGWLGDASLAYVVLLELVLVFGLLSRNPFVFYATLVQFLIFHIYSWHIVGYFYPCIMFCLLAVFPLARLERSDGDDSLGARLLARKLPRSTIFVLAAYAAAQVAPVLFPGDNALTGEGRMFALNMLDAKSECSLELVARDGNVHTEHATLGAGLGTRIRCEPLVYFNAARGLCNDGASEVDLGLVARRTTDTWFQRLVGVTDLCGKHLEYDVWRHNAWIER